MLEYAHPPGQTVKFPAFALPANNNPNTIIPTVILRACPPQALLLFMISTISLYIKFPLIQIFENTIRKMYILILISLGTINKL